MLTQDSERPLDKLVWHVVIETIKRPRSAEPSRAAPHRQIFVRWNILNGPSSDDSPKCDLSASLPYRAHIKALGTQTAQPLFKAVFTLIIAEMNYK